MGERASRRRRRRRQRTGFVLLAVLTVGVLGGLFAFTAEPWRQAGEKQPLERMSSPSLEKAPDAVAEATKKEEKKSEEPEEQASRPDGEQQAAAEQEADEQAQPQAVAAPSSSSLSLTVPKMGRYNDPVANSVDPGVLANGAGKLPASGFPWQSGANTYIAGHVYGYEGTGSWQQFANLPSMTYGDLIYLTDADGNAYTYAVSEILQVSPYDLWVTAPVAGRTMVTLQTCTGPGWSQRLIVRGELVSTQST